MQIFSNIDNIVQNYPALKISDSEKQILVRYFSRGGLIKTKRSEKFQIIYPNKSKIKEELKRLKNEINTIEDKLRSWKKTKKDSEGYISKLKVKKMASKLYWQHKYKYMSDKKYREDFDKVGINIDLIADPKIGKIVKEFMNNDNYRENLVETIGNSLIYEGRSIGEQINNSLSIKLAIADKKIELFTKTYFFYKNQYDALKLILRWTVE